MMPIQYFTNIGLPVSNICGFKWKLIKTIHLLLEHYSIFQSFPALTIVIEWKGSLLGLQQARVRAGVCLETIMTRKNICDVSVTARWTCVSWQLTRRRLLCDVRHGNDVVSWTEQDGFLFSMRSWRLIAFAQATFSWWLESGALWLRHAHVGLHT